MTPPPSLPLSFFIAFGLITLKGDIVSEPSSPPPSPSVETSFMDGPKVNYKKRRDKKIIYWHFRRVRGTCEELTINDYLIAILRVLRNYLFIDIKSTKVTTKYSPFLLGNHWAFIIIKYLTFEIKQRIDSDLLFSTWTFEFSVSDHYLRFECRHGSV